MNLANKLTLLRIGLAVGVFLALTRGEASFHLAAFFLFLAAVVTDWVDGYVARKTHSISAFGKVADPIADKILILGTLIALLRSKELEIPLWGVFFIIARELLIGGMRILTSAQGHIPVAEPWGKWKMGIQSGSILVMLAILVLTEQAAPPFGDWLVKLPYYLTILCVAVAWSSAYQYFKQSQKVLEKTWS